MLAAGAPRPVEGSQHMLISATTQPTETPYLSVSQDCPQVDSMSAGW